MKELFGNANKSTTGRPIYSYIIYIYTESATSKNPLEDRSKIRTPLERMTVTVVKMSFNFCFGGVGMFAIENTTFFKLDAGCPESPKTV